MSEEAPKKKMTNVTYPKRVPVYDTEDGLELWKAIARRRGANVTTLARQLVREEARRLGMPVPGEGASDE